MAKVSPINAGNISDYPDFSKNAAGFVMRLGHPFGNFSRIYAAYNFENADVAGIRGEMLRKLRYGLAKRIVRRILLAAGKWEE